MTLDTRWLPPATLKVFEHLRTQALLGDFTLIGGSALALQIATALARTWISILPAIRCHNAR